MAILFNQSRCFQPRPLTNKCWIFSYRHKILGRAIPLAAAATSSRSPIRSCCLVLVQMTTVSLNPMVQLRGVAVKSRQASEHKDNAAKARWAEQNLTSFSFPILGFLTFPNTIAAQYTSMIPMVDRMRVWSNWDDFGGYAKAGGRGRNAVWKCWSGGSLKRLVGNWTTHLDRKRPHTR